VSVATLVDASVLLTLAFDEPGADAALDVLARPRLGITSTNLAEVVSKLRQRGMPLEGCRQFIADLQLTVVSADSETVLVAGDLHAATRAVGLSMADALCLASAAQLGARVVTADRAWGRLDVGVEIEVIR
jgi:PIN domain nuclease of toxin-antitoxin system